jgi:hypothetical protein
MYLCSPKWDGDWISESDLERGLTVLSGTIAPSPYGRDSISLSAGLHFSGGEPFLNYPLLLRAVEIAGSFRIPSTFVETNCFWCRDDKGARKKLTELKKAGMAGIMISVNPFYAEYVPFERTERCVRVSREVFGENTLIYQMEYYRLFKMLGIKDRISIEDFLELTSSEHLVGRVEMFFMGRAADRLKDYYRSHPAEMFFNLPCQSPLIREWHNHFDNYSNFMPGFCGGISLGNWLELDELIETGIELDDRPILAFLVNDDMIGLFRYASEVGYEEAESGFLSKCDLCINIRRFLVTKGDYIELQPKEFYSAD